MLEIQIRRPAFLSQSYLKLFDESISMKFAEDE
jgi:hypothetical protein